MYATASMPSLDDALTTNIYSNVVPQFPKHNQGKLCSADTQLKVFNNNLLLQLLGKYGKDMV